MSSLKILVIADLRILVPPQRYGGAEGIVHLYAEEFTRLGHTVHLLAGPGSRAYGDGGVHIHHAPSLTYPSRARRKLQFLLKSLLAARDCDFVFSHGRFDYLEGLLKIGVSLVHMAYNPLDQRQIKSMEKRVNRKRFLLYGVSHNQLSRAPTRLPRFVIRNFVNMQNYRFSDSSSGCLAFLGRFIRNKRVHAAIRVSQRSGRPLRIAGNVPNEPGARDYFDEYICPFLNGESMVYVGPVDDQQSQDFLGSADALLFPAQWSEPCAVVISESLACGTPVIAFDIASNSELIEPGLTGVLCLTVGDASQMADAVTQIETFSRVACRRVAEERFDVRDAPRRLLSRTADILGAPA